MSASSRTVRWRLVGRVQRIGFRAFTVRQARRLGVVGEVKNLPDGSVEILVRAEPERLAAFRAAVERGPIGARVDRVEESELPASGDWQEFTVAHW